MHSRHATPQIHRLFESLVETEGSDLHLNSGKKPLVRVHGEVQELSECDVLSPEDARRYIHEIMPEINRKQFEECLDTDFGYEVQGLGRFRANVFVDHHGIGGVFRLIPSDILTADDLGLPQAVRDLCQLSKGLVVVTGPTGSGKSTTLAAMIDLINKERAEHIITIEDPIEFVHPSGKCLINQREVHSHTRSFASALRAALREDPDIVLVGEMRDLETIEIALETAETGHLVFGTLHTATAAGTVDRIIDKFPSDRQNQIRTMLASSLKGVIAQTLCKRADKGRVAALEILLITQAVASNIREGKTYQVMSAMQTGRNLGMQLLNDGLLKLVTQGIVTPREAYLRAVEKEDLKQKFSQAGVDMGVTAAEPSTQPAQDAQSLVASLREKLRVQPDDCEAMNNLAWILATSETAEGQERREAVQLATQAHRATGGRDLSVTDTLAAAYASAGEFGRAIDTVKRGLRQAESARQTDRAEEFKRHLALYKSRRPLREP